MIDLQAITYVQVRQGVFTQRILTIHRTDAGPTHLPFPRSWHPLDELWYVFAPLVGARFIVDPAVAAAGR